MAKQIFLNAELNRNRGSDYYEQGIINLVWRELEGRFGFPSKEWHLLFTEYCHREGLDRINGFYHFGREVINPVLNQTLRRNSDYPTFEKMVSYLREREPK